MLKYALLTGFAVLSLVVTAQRSMAQKEEATLLAESRIAGEWLGFRMDFDGEVVLAGAPFTSSDGFSRAGRALVFAETDSGWEQKQQILPSRRQDDAFFGMSVALDGKTMAVGAHSEDAESIDDGAVYVYQRRGGVWREKARIVSPTAQRNGRFGSAVDLINGTLLVGAPGEDNNTGAVHVFERQGRRWLPVDILKASDGVDFDIFGVELTARDDLLIISALGDDINGVEDAGSAYVYRNVEGRWGEETKIAHPQPQDTAEFGTAAAIQDDTIFITSPFHSVNGEVHVFEFKEGDWKNVDVIRSPVGGDARYGQSVSIEGDRLVVGAFGVTREGVWGAGQAFLYRRVGDEWRLDDDFFPEFVDPMFFGRVVVIHGDRVASSAPFHTKDQGAAYLFNGFNGGIECSGREKVASAKCRATKGGNKLVVRVKRATPSDTFQVRLGDGQSKQGSIANDGIGKVRFKKQPSSDGTARTAWGCGAYRTADYDCP